MASSIWVTKILPSPILPVFAEPIIAETAASLIEGAENREEIIRRISSFVSGQIDYEDLSFQYSAHVPQTAESVLEDRYGDCKDQSVLLIALLSASGIDAHIALSYPGYAGDNTFLPSPRFTHAFVIVPGPDGDLILDPTPGSYTFPELPAEMSGSWYLPITPPAEGSAAELRRIGPAFDPDMTWIVYAIEAGTETSRIQASATYSGYHADMVRALHATAEDPLSRLYFSLLLEREMPGFRLEEAAARHMDDLSLSPAIEFTGTFPGLLTSLGKEAAALSLPWSVTLSPSLLGIGRAEGGSAALRVSYPELATPKKQVMIVTLPPGYALRSLPENAVLRYKTARAIFRYSSRGGKLICERELCVPVMNIPREEADDFSAFVTGVFEKERELILIAPLAGLYGTEGRR